MEVHTLQQQNTRLSAEQADGKFRPVNEELIDSGIDVSKILIQVLQRPIDPISRGLQEAIYSWVAAGMAYQPVVDEFGGWIDVARNWQSKLFLKAKKFDWLLMVDADVTPPLMAPVLLARHKLPVVSACVAGYDKERAIFLCVAAKASDGCSRFPSIKSKLPVPARGLAKVTNAGTGCLLVRRDVIESIWNKKEEEKAEREDARQVLLKILEHRGKIELREDELKRMWNFAKRFDLHQDFSGGPFDIPQTVREHAADTGVMAKGEDMCFTDRVRAAGFDIYVDFEVQCGHDKKMRLQWPSDLIDANLDVANWQVTPFDVPVGQP